MAMSILVRASNFEAVHLELFFGERGDHPIGDVDKVYCVRHTCRRSCGDARPILAQLVL